MARYQYAALDEEAQEIRLLTLLPGAFSDEVKILIHTTQLSESIRPQYEALSYLWGPPPKGDEVSVGLSDQQTLPITHNLAVALPYLRRKDRVRALWIDAICINQNDLEERSRQVERMADIYKLAARVVVWLGPETGTSDHALDLFQALGPKVEIDWTGSGAVRPVTNSEGETSASGFESLLPQQDSDFEALLRLFNNPWFERVWTRQEIRLANFDAVIKCGTSSIFWNDFRTAVQCIVTQTHYGRTPTGFMDRAMLVRRSIFRFEDLIPLLQDTRRSKASDARDKIYSLIGMLDDSYGHHFGIKPDYEKTKWQVYRDAFLRFALSNALTVLTMCEMLSHSDDTHPSWVPDWSAEKETIGLHDVLWASGGTTPEMVYKPNEPGVLYVAGTQCASVSQIQSTLFRHRTLRETITKTWSMFESVGNLDDPYVGGGSLLEAFCQTTLCDTFQERWESSPSTMCRLTDGIAALRHVLQRRGDITEGFASEIFNRPDHIRYWNAVYMTFKSRLFFTTNEGYIGMGPPCAEAGDLVAVVVGCYSPMMLRPAGGHFKVVGECYVCGLSDGEAFLGPIPRPYRALLIWKRSPRQYTLACRNRETEDIEYTDPRLPPGSTPQHTLQVIHPGEHLISIHYEAQSDRRDIVEDQDDEAAISSDADLQSSSRTDHRARTTIQSPGRTGAIGGRKRSRFGSISREYVLPASVDPDSSDPVWSVQALKKNGIDIVWLALT